MNSTTGTAAFIVLFKRICACLHVRVCSHACVCLCLYTSVIRRISSLFSLISREWRTHLKLFSGQFLVESTEQHQKILTHMGLENFGLAPCFSNLRNNMRELVKVLAAVAAGLPQQHYGFYRLEALLSHIFIHNYTFILHTSYIFTSVSLVCFSNGSLFFLFSGVQRAAWHSAAFISASS